MPQKGVWIHARRVCDKVALLAFDRGMSKKRLEVAIELN